MEKMIFEVGVNIASLMHLGFQPIRFPGCSFAKPQKLIDEAIEDGWDGVQMLPIRGATGQETKVLCYEDPWNAVNSLPQALLHGIGSAGLPSCINDWVVSPTPDECSIITEQFSNRRFRHIDHKFGGHPEFDIVEIHPGLDMTIPEIVQSCQGLTQKVCFDTFHIRREYRPDEITQKPERAGKLSPIGTWTEAIVALARYVRVIHLHPDEDLEEFTSDNPNRSISYIIAKVLISSIMELKRVGGQADILTLIAEYNPGKKAILHSSTSREVSRRMLRTTKQLIRDATEPYKTKIN